MNGKGTFEKMSKGLQRIELIWSENGQQSQKNIGERVKKKKMIKGDGGRTPKTLWQTRSQTIKTIKPTKCWVEEQRERRTMMIVFDFE